VLLWLDPAVGCVEVLSLLRLCCRVWGSRCTTPLCGRHWTYCVTHTAWGYPGTRWVLMYCSNLCTTQQPGDDYVSAAIIALAFA
jgi:hypothetical protein